MAQNKISNVILVSLGPGSASSLGIASPGTTQDCLDHAFPKKYYGRKPSLPTCADLQ